MWIEATESQINSKTEEARKILNKLITLYPNDERVQNFMATTYFGTRQYKESIKYYLKAIEINPEYSPSYNLLGYTYKYLKNYNEAEKNFQKYIELIPNDPNPYDSYGELLLQMGRFDESISNYEKALQINPYFTFSYLGIASNLNYKGEHVKARNRLQQLLTTATNYNQKRIAYEGIIISYIDEGNYAAALKISEELLQFEIKSPDTLMLVTRYVSLGNLYTECGKLSEAEELFTKGLQIAEKSNYSGLIKSNFKNNILYNFAYLDVKRKKFVDALQKAEKFLTYAKDQENPILLKQSNQLFGIIALEQKDYNKAIEYFRKSNQDNPYNLYRIATAFEYLGDSERAISYYSKAANAHLVSNRNYSVIRLKAVEKLKNK